MPQKITVGEMRESGVRGVPVYWADFRRRLTSIVVLIVKFWGPRPSRVSDNRPELTGMTVLRFSQERQNRAALHRATRSSSNARLRDELL
jgi:hypothetical protein